MPGIKVLYVTFSFPPVLAAAALRATKITNLLHGHGVQPVVLTKNLVEDRHIHRTTDMATLRYVDRRTRVLRAYFQSPSVFELPFIIKEKLTSLFRKGAGKVAGKNAGSLMKKDPLVPDHYLPDWFPFAWIKAIFSKAARTADIIYASGPPFTVFILGYLLKAWLRKPLVVEYRDPWTDDPYKPWEFGYKERLNKWLEGLVLRAADGVVCISDPLRDQLVMKHGLESQARKFITVESAFDEKDFKDIRAEPVPPGRFLLSLTTTLYGRRDPSLLFETLGEMKRDGVFEGIDVKLEIYGNNPASQFKHLLEANDIQDIVEFKGFVPHDKCLQVLKSSTMNLDLSEKDVDYPSFPYHVWEYIGSGKKFLYLGKDNSYKANYIEKHNLGIVLPLDKPATFKKRFRKVIEAFKDGTLETEIHPGDVRRQTWGNRVSRLARLFRAISRR